MVAALQAIAFGALATAGFFYQDDLDYTGQGDSPLTVGYLLDANNDHLAPGLRLVYWLLAHTAPYEHGVSVVLRVLVQAVATLLFARLLVRLYGPRPVALLGTAAYASAVLTLPSFLSLSSAVNLLPTHLATILLLDCWVRHQLTGRLRYAAYGAAALLVGLLFWEKAALALLLLPLLTVAVLAEGPARDRVRSVRWPGLALCAAPVVAFGALYLARSPGNGPQPVSPLDLARLGWDSWGRSVAPAIAGGPWRWFAGPDVYASVADPPVAGIVAGQLVVLALLVLAVRRHGRAALLPWTLPAAWLAGNVLLLGVGRYAEFGGLVGRTYHYLSDLTVPLVLAIVTSLVRVRPAEVADRVGPVIELPAERGRVHPLVLAALVAYAASLAVTVHGYERRWVQNPTEGYLATVVAQLRAVPGAQVIDTPVSPRVLSPYARHRRLSQVLGPLDLDIRWDDRVGGEPRMLDDAGRLVESGFRVAARTTTDPKSCGHRLDGTGTAVIRLDRALPAGDHFVRIDYLLGRGSAVDIRLGAGDTLTDPVRGVTRELRAGLAGLLLQTGGAPVDRVEITSQNIALGLCVTEVTAGVPEPA